MPIDPGKVAEAKHTMSDEQYYLLTKVANGNKQVFDTMASQYLDHANQQAAARQSELEQQQREYINGIVNDLMGRKEANNSQSE